MILVGQYDSPFVRRVAIALRLLGFAYEHDQRSVFGDFESMRQTNPLGRVPSLILDDGTVLVESAAILDHLDQEVGPGRALLPAGGAARREALQRVALMTGALDKVIAVNYERRLRPASYRWADWIERCLTQATGALAELDALGWPAGPPGQADITAAVGMLYIRLTAPDIVPAGRYPGLESLAERLEARPEFRATRPDAVTYPAPPAG